MIYALTHGLTLRRKLEGFVPNPSHTDQGLIEISTKPLISLLHLFNIKHVRVGEGLRFIELFLAVKPAFKEGVQLVLCPFLGPAFSTVHRPDGDCLITSCGFGFFIENYEWVANCYEAFDGWKYLKGVSEHFQGNILLCTGKQFMKAIGTESKNASLYEISIESRHVACLMEEGIFNSETDLTI